MLAHWPGEGVWLVGGGKSVVHYVSPVGKIRVGACARHPLLAGFACAFEALKCS